MSQELCTILARFLFMELKENSMKTDVTYKKAIIIKWNATQASSYVPISSGTEVMGKRKIFFWSTQ